MAVNRHGDGADDKRGLLGQLVELDDQLIVLGAGEAQLVVVHSQGPHALAFAELFDLDLVHERARVGADERLAFVLNWGFEGIFWSTHGVVANTPAQFAGLPDEEGQRHDVQGEAGTHSQNVLHDGDLGADTDALAHRRLA